MEENIAALDIKAINEKIERESAFIDLLTMEMNKVIVGQKHMVERLLIGLLGQGHILLEGVPGLAKTLAINTLSQAAHELLLVHEEFALPKRLDLPFHKRLLNSDESPFAHPPILDNR